MMRGTPGMRLALAILSPAFLVLWLVAIHSEETRPWVRYQEEFNQLYLRRARAKLQEAEGRKDTAEQGRWQRIIDEVSHSRPEIAQVYLEDIKVADRCVTCHRGIDNPLLRDAPELFRTHPGELLKFHDINTFGCTPCHDGQGVATTADAAHGREANWGAPMLPKAYTQASCMRCHEITHGVKGAELISHGADVFMDKGCYGCHDVKGVSYQPKFSPPLGTLNAKLAEVKNWTFNWIKDPARLSRETLMPNFKLTDEEIGKITTFLLSFPDSKHYPHVALEGASAQEGERLFTERGCRGCHGMKADESSVSPRVPHLAGVGSKVTPEWLDRWISEPKAYDPDSAMPKVALTDEERHNLVAYLLTLKRSDPLPPAPDLGQYTAADGKQLLKQYECYGCHALEGFEQVRPSVPDLGEFARKPLDELDFGLTKDLPRTKWDWLQRKLKDPRAYNTDKIKLKMPSQNLTEADIQALITYTLALDERTMTARYVVRATPAKQGLRDVSWMTSRLNCNGCHRLNELDGHIVQFFERKNMAPPTLDGEGARLQGQYMYEFLLEPRQVRPWLKIRMPTFPLNEAQVHMLVDGVAARTDTNNPYTYVAKANIPEDHFKRGIHRFRHYKCVQCHPTSIDQGLPEGVDPEDLSINLTLVKTRLRPQWIRDFMARPKQIAGTQTRMPTVFYTVDGDPKVEKPKEDIDDITTYLTGMVEAPEVTLKAEQEQEEAKKAEEQQPDWTKIQY
ncbi:MAG: cytochrome c [Candidatus Binatia bacterium]|jgi:mono/diheme cytochrome c family protein